jgi:hypothetical protein
MNVSRFGEGRRKGKSLFSRLMSGVSFLKVYCYT